MQTKSKQALFNKEGKQHSETDVIPIQVSNEFSIKIHETQEIHSIPFIPVSKAKYTVEELQLQCAEASQIIQDLRVQRNLSLQQLRKMFSEIVHMEKALCKLQSTTTTTTTKRSSNKHKARK